MCASACAAIIHHGIMMHFATQEAGMPPPPLRRLVRAGSASSIHSQQPMAGSSQAPAPKTTAGASLVQAAKPAAANQAADTAAAAPPVTDKLLKPWSQSQSQLGGKVSLMQSDLSPQYVGGYQEQPDEEDVDILEESHAVPPTVDAQQPAAGEAEVAAVAFEEAATAGTAEAADNGVAKAPAPGIAGTPADAGNATARDAANPLPSSRSSGTSVLPDSNPVVPAACCGPTLSYGSVPADPLKKKKCIASSCMSLRSTQASFREQWQAKLDKSVMA